VRESLAKFRLCRVEVDAVTVGVYERVHRIFRRAACNELPVSPPQSRVRCDPDVRGNAAESSKAALDVSSMLRIPHTGQRNEGACADNLQLAVAVTNGKRIRRAAASVSPGDVRRDCERTNANGVAVLEHAIDPHRWVTDESQPQENSQWQDDVRVITTVG
jgi:hypothetical protein